MKRWRDNSLLYCYMVEGNLGASPVEVAAFARHWDPTGEPFTLTVRDVMKLFQVPYETALGFMQDLGRSRVFCPAGQGKWVMRPAHLRGYRAWKRRNHLDDRNVGLPVLELPTLGTYGMLLSDNWRGRALEDLFGTKPGDVARFTELSPAERLDAAGFGNRWALMLFLGSVPVAVPGELVLLGFVGARMDMGTGESVLPGEVVKELAGVQGGLSTRLQGLHDAGLLDAEPVGGDVVFTVTATGAAVGASFLARSGTAY